MNIQVASHFGIIYMGSILSVSVAKIGNTQKTNYMCIIVGFRPIFWYNIHGVNLVCELS